MDSKHTFIQIHPKDNTAVALTSLKKGQRIESEWTYVHFAGRYSSGT